MIFVAGLAVDGSLVGCDAGRIFSLNGLHGGDEGFAFFLPWADFALGWLAAAHGLVGFDDVRQVSVTGSAIDDFFARWIGSFGCLVKGLHRMLNDFMVIGGEGDLGGEADHRCDGEGEGAD